MKHTFLQIAAVSALMSTVAFAQTATKETSTSTTTATDASGNTSSQSTTTTTESSGTITEFSPGATIVLKETAGPRSYQFGKTVTYVTKSGTALTEADVKTRIKVGIPVHVSYATEGGNMVVSRVMVDE